MIAELRNRFRASFIKSDAPMPITSVPDLLADVQSRRYGTGRRSRPRAPTILVCISIGTPATDSSSSATSTKNH